MMMSCPIFRHIVPFILFVTQEVYDFTMKMTRLDYNPGGFAKNFYKLDLNPLTEIHDFNTGNHPLILVPSP